MDRASLDHRHIMPPHNSLKALTPSRPDDIYPTALLYIDLDGRPDRNITLETPSTNGSLAPDASSSAPVRRRTTVSFTSPKDNCTAS